MHLMCTCNQQKNLLKLLQKIEEIFDTSLGEWEIEAVSFEKVLGAQPTQSKVLSNLLFEGYGKSM